ncbi:MAG: hydroxyacid dehydrogenase [Hyphomicrobiales bacterium]|nr:hydroxyacid dehydrogenase [Hyphomicrobiales bacterium]
MARIIISEFMDESAVRDGFKAHEVVYDPGLVDDPARLASLVAGAQALVVRNRTQVRGALLAGAPGLKVIGRLGVGLDNIDVAACTARGIAVCPATGANDVAVAEYVLAAAMMLLRGAYQATPAMTEGAWPREALIGREISGKTLGLVGFGAIARETARRAAVLGVRLVAYDPFLKPDDPAWSAYDVTPQPFEDLLAEADIVSLHVPLTDATRGLFNAEALTKMKPGAVLVNAARGGIVDAEALAAALLTGHLGGAALDVFAREPLRGDDGIVFRDVPNLILTPHIAGVTEESNVRVSWVTVKNVLAHLGGG